MFDQQAEQRLRDDLVAIVEQGRQLLEEIDRECYRAATPNLELASMGDHYRHLLDYIAAFLRGVQAGRIDYDDRRRDQQIATDPCAAVEETMRVRGELLSLEFSRLPSDLQVLQRTREDGVKRPLIRSNVQREITFLISHSMHHYAIIAIAARLQGLRPPSKLGVMPSTLRHRRAESLYAEAAE